MLKNALRAVASQIAANVDRAVYSAALARNEKSRRASRAESLGHQQRLEALAAIAALYDEPRLIDEPDAFFPRPEPTGGRASRVRSYETWGEVLDVAWKSEREPYCALVRDRVMAHEENGVGLARLFAHRDRPRPSVVLVHGYLGGTLALEERFWPVRSFFEMGLDVALFVMPFHGARRRSQVSRPVFPSSDPRFTIEGFRQAVADLRWLIGWLEARGSKAVGVMGMSLGGYTTSLLATVEPRLAFAVPLVPLASIADFARDGGRLVGSPEEQAAQHQAIERAHQVVSPFARPARLPADRMVVVAGQSDQITPLAHAERLAAHLGAPLEVFPGGHLFQVGRGEAFRPVERILERLIDEG